uniref:Uncharacterized protein n=1 Tax=Plectus sambesii TaxID=2011161 RepID=A0A914VCZ1_9BILA
MERLIARIDCLTVLYVRLRRLGDKYYSCSVDDKELFVRESQVMQRQQEAVGLAKSTEETHLRPEQPAVLCELQNDCAILE